MFPLYRMFTVFCLVFAIAVVSAQSDFWSPLNGPNGVQEIKNISSDASGRLFMMTSDEIYTSVDNGNSWVLCMDSLPIQVYSVEFIPSPSGDMFLQVRNGLYGEGLFRYNPVNNIWVKTNMPDPALGGANIISIDLQGRIWVGVYGINNEVHYSTDGGQSFQKVSLNAQIPGSWEAMATFDSTNNLVATLNAVYRFEIDGTVQLLFNNNSSNQYLAFSPNTGTAFQSDYSNFRRSTDGGLTWQPIAIMPGQSSNPQVTDMTFEPGGRIWIHTFNRIYWSEDDGVTWTTDPAFFGFYGASHRANNGDWFLSNSCDNPSSIPQFARSNDDGATWTDLSAGIQKPTVFEIQKDASGALFALTCRKRTFEKSDDEGQTWTDFFILDSAAVYIVSLAARPDGVMMAVGGNGKMYRSLDKGATWIEMTNVGIIGGADRNTKFYTDNAGVFYMIDESVGMYKSVDDGATWTLLAIAGSLNNFLVAFHPNGSIYLIRDGVLSRYDADANILSEVLWNSNPVFDVSELHCTKNGTLYVASTSLWPFFSGLFKISNGGNTLEEIPFFDFNHLVTGITSNVESDVFVMAGTDLYRSEDDGATWEKIATTPPNINLNTLYVAPDQHLYAGFSGEVIHRSNNPTAENNIMSGKIWFDDDGDCQLDAGEKLQSSVAVTATGNGDYTSFSGYNGNFVLAAPSGTYALNVQPPNALFEACFTDVPVTLNGPNDSAWADLPIRIVVQCPYLSVNLTTPILRRCFDITYTVRYKNEGTAIAQNAFVEITLDSFFIFQNSSLQVASQSGQAYTFQLGDLAPGQSGSFNIVLKVSCDASLGQNHCIAAQIQPSDLCMPTLPPLAFYQECRQNIGAFDPNDKRAFVGGKEEPGYVLPNTDIEYLIRFQNTGTDTAFRVVVEDRVSTLLDLASVTPLVSSHPFTMEVKDQRILRFVFENIYLPDSNINAAASNGFVKFRVSQMPNAALGSVIKNDADIFFDFNAPVRTNESSLMVGTVSAKLEPGNPYLIWAYPNPFHVSITFEVRGPSLPANATLRLFDALGRQVRREEFSGQKFVVQRNEIGSGLYYFLIESEGKQVGAGKVLAK